MTYYRLEEEEMAVSFRDYYEILGVDRTATGKEIKAGYRKLARKWHPDLHPAGEKDEAEEKFKGINEAYEVLKDPEKRERYDRLGSRWRDGDNFRAPPGMDGIRFDSGFGQAAGDGFSEFFEMMFGRRQATGARRSAGKVRGQDIESEIQLAIEEAYAGTIRAIRVAGSSVCQDCAGTGTDGTGLCHRCGGTGFTSEERNLEVRIPAGVQEGSRIRLKQQGGAGLGGGPRGDLYLKVRFLQHPQFRLNGSNVESDIVIRPEQAVLGDRVPMMTVDGPVTITVPADTRARTRLRLRGKGYPDRQNRRGDHLVRVVLDIPRDITDAERALYEKLHTLRQERSVTP